jgi:hypothetical protein
MFLFCVEKAKLDDAAQQMLQDIELSINYVDLFKNQVRQKIMEDPAPSQVSLAVYIVREHANVLKQIKENLKDNPDLLEKETNKLSTEAERLKSEQSKRKNKNGYLKSVAEMKIDMSYLAEIGLATKAQKKNLKKKNKKKENAELLSVTKQAQKELEENLRDIKKTEILNYLEEAYYNRKEIIKAKELLERKHETFDKETINNIKQDDSEACKFMLYVFKRFRKPPHAGWEYIKQANKIFKKSEESTQEKCVLVANLIERSLECSQKMMEIQEEKIIDYQNTMERLKDELQELENKEHKVKSKKEYSISEEVVEKPLEKKKEFMGLKKGFLK